jgi:hypothetical protein
VAVWPVLEDSDSPEVDVNPVVEVDDNPVVAVAEPADGTSFDPRRLVPGDLERPCDMLFLASGWSRMARPSKSSVKRELASASGTRTCRAQCSGQSTRGAAAWMKVKSWQLSTCCYVCSSAWSMKLAGAVVGRGSTRRADFCYGLLA